MAYAISKALLEEDYKIDHPRRPQLLEVQTKLIELIAQVKRDRTIAAKSDRDDRLEELQ